MINKIFFQFLSFNMKINEEKNYKTEIDDSLQSWSKYAKAYDPIKCASIDGIDTEPHDRAVIRALNSTYKPNRFVKGRPECTIFVSRLNHETSKDTIKEIFSKYGKLKRFRMVKDIVTGMPKGYAFVEFEEEHAAEDAYKSANKTVVDGNIIFVDFECERLLKDWRPRRLGGGFAGKKESGQLRFGGRDRPFKKPIALELKEKEEKKQREKKKRREDEQRLRRDKSRERFKRRSPPFQNGRNSPKDRSRHISPLKDKAKQPLSTREKDRDRSPPRKIARLKSPAKEIRRHRSSPRENNKEYSPQRTNVKQQSPHRYSGRPGSPRSNIKSNSPPRENIKYSPSRKTARLKSPTREISRHRSSPRENSHRQVGKSGSPRGYIKPSSPPRENIKRYQSPTDRKRHRSPVQKIGRQQSPVRENVEHLSPIRENIKYRSPPRAKVGNHLNVQENVIRYSASRAENEEQNHYSPAREKNVEHHSPPQNHFRPLQARGTDKRRSPIRKNDPMYQSARDNIFFPRDDRYRSPVREDVRQVSLRRNERHFSPSREYHSPRENIKSRSPDRENTIKRPVFTQVGIKRGYSPVREHVKHYSPSREQQFSSSKEIRYHSPHRQTDRDFSNHRENSNYHSSYYSEQDAKHFPTVRENARPFSPPRDNFREPPQFCDKFGDFPSPRENDRYLPPPRETERECFRSKVNDQYNSVQEPRNYNYIADEQNSNFSPVRDTQFSQFRDNMNWQTNPQERGRRFPSRRGRGKFRGSVRRY